MESTPKIDPRLEEVIPKRGYLSTDMMELSTENELIVKG